MTCHPTSIHADAADRLQCEALVRAMANPALLSGPALSTSTQQSNGDLSNMIASRCKAQQFRSNEVRKRYLALHRTLSRGC